MIECFLRGVEIRIGPHCAKLRCTDIIGVGCRFDIDSIADRWQFPSGFVNLALVLVQPDYLVDFLVRPTPLVDVALDDLNPIKIAAFGVLQSPNCKAC